MEYYIFVFRASVNKYGILSESEKGIFFFRPKQLVVRGDEESTD